MCRAIPWSQKCEKQGNLTSNDKNKKNKNKKSPRALERIGKCLKRKKTCWMDFYTQTYRYRLTLEQDARWMHH